MSESSSKDTEPTDAPSLPIVYVGPSTPILGLIKYHHYTELELNDQVQQAIRDNPALNVLLIPLDVFVGIASDIYAGTNASVQHASEYLQSKGVI